MEQLFFGGEEFHRLYNCSFYNVSSIPVEQRRNIPLGIAEIIIGTIEFSLYIPCMVSIWWNREISCYKILFVMGVMDMVNLMILGPISGYFTLAGTVYCSCPTFIYILGSIATGLTVGEQIVEILLALNRLLYFTSERLAKKLFQENSERTWIYTIPPLFFSFFYTIFGQPAIFTAVIHQWAWNPHWGYATKMNELFLEYGYFCYSLNEYVVMITLPAIYITFILFVIKQHQMINSKDQRFLDPTAAIVQVSLISLVNFASCFMFTVISILSLINDPEINIKYIPTIATIHLWCNMQVHGLPPIIYLFLNDTIQENCLTMIEMIINKLSRF